MAELRFTARLEAQALEPQRELAELIAASAGDGAVVSFVGLARPQGAGGSEVDTLVLEHHPTLTERSLLDLAADALNRFGVSRTWVVHRCGSVAAGEAIVFAAATARHRRAAFEAADYLMDRLKTDAVFWKREQGTAGRRWIEPSDEDYAARARWAD